MTITKYMTILSMTAVPVLPVLMFSRKAGNDMKEQSIEYSLRDAVKGAGGVCWKFVSPGTSGVPDRIILMPQGHMAFVEVKSPGEKPRALQLSRHRLLKQLGFKVYVLDNKADIQKIIEEVQNETA